MKNSNIIIAVIICLPLMGCVNFKAKVGSPWMQDLMNKGPDGPVNFQLGWRHGCETGISATANKLQQHFYKFRQDYRLVEDPSYYAGWKSSYDYCQRYVFQYLRRNIF